MKECKRLRFAAVPLSAALLLATCSHQDIPQTVTDESQAVRELATPVYKEPESAQDIEPEDVEPMQIQTIDTLIQDSYINYLQSPYGRHAMRNHISRAGKYRRHFKRYGKMYSIDPELAMALIINESAAYHYCRNKTPYSYTPRGRRMKVSTSLIDKMHDLCRGPRGAVGMAQLQPYYVQDAKNKGVDATTPAGNLRWGLRHYAQCVRQAYRLTEEVNGGKMDDVDDKELLVLGLHIYNAGLGKMQKIVRRAGSADYMDYLPIMKRALGKHSRYSLRIFAKKLMVEDYYNHGRRKVKSFWKEQAENSRKTREAVSSSKRQERMKQHSKKRRGKRQDVRVAQNTRGRR